MESLFHAGLVMLQVLCGRTVYSFSCSIKFSYMYMYINSISQDLAGQVLLFLRLFRFSNSSRIFFLTCCDKKQKKGVRRKLAQKYICSFWEVLLKISIRYYL